MVATLVRILVVEDRESRVKALRSWSPPDTRIVWAKSAGSAIGIIKRDPGRVYDGIMLDHDLNEQGMTQHEGLYSGKHVVKAILQQIENDVPVFVHSANASGGPAMAEMLRGEGFDVQQVPMGQLTSERFQVWLDVVRRAKAEVEE